MLGDILYFDESYNETQKIELLYAIFKNDFIDNPTYLNQTIFIDPKSHDKTEDKEKIFWHIVTKTNPRTKQREYDENRASRIKWIKQIILNYFDKEIKLFYHYENRQKVIRLYLWAYNYDFVVIIQKLGKKASYLVTSFYIDKKYNKKIYEKRYNDYINNKDEKLKNCEWF